MKGPRGTLHEAIATVDPASALRRSIAPSVRGLIERGAGRLPHTGRAFVEHLIGTWRILTLWKQPPDLCLAGLYHSGYGTQHFHSSLFGHAERGGVRALIG